MSLCKQTGEIGLCNSSAAASLCPKGAREREKRKRSGNDGRAFRYFFFDWCIGYQVGAPAKERARHVASRRVKTLKKKLAYENHLRLFSFKFFTYCACEVKNIILITS